MSKAATRTARPFSPSGWTGGAFDGLKEGNLAAAEFHFWWLVAEMVQAAQQAGSARK